MKQFTYRTFKGKVGYRGVININENEYIMNSRIGYTERHLIRITEYYIL